MAHLHRNVSGQSALVTGGGNGLGRGFAIQLAKLGASVSVVDFDVEAAEAVAREIRAFGGDAIASQADVTNSRQHENAFKRHMAVFGRLDIAILNAGISESDSLIYGNGDKWKKCLDVDLTAVLEGTRFAARAMTDPKLFGSVAEIENGPINLTRKPNLLPISKRIVAVASMAAVYPSPGAPVYSAAKAGVVSAVKSLVPRLLQLGIGLTALCPEFTRTNMVQAMGDITPLVKLAGGILTVDQVVEAGVYLATGDVRSGASIGVRASDGRWESVSLPLLKPFEAEQTTERGSRVRDASNPLGLPARSLAAWASWAAPYADGSVASYRQIQINTLGNDLRKVSTIVRVPAPPPSQPLPPGTALVRLAHAGVNASDINWSAGRYHPNLEAARRALPLKSGFEGVGVVARVSDEPAYSVDAKTGERRARPTLAVGTPVALMSYGCFSDAVLVRQSELIPLVRPDAGSVGLLTSGLTAIIGIREAGRLKEGETIVVTAAAGGLGQLVVQLAKLAGARVVATVGSDDKAELVRSLGADEIINYRKEKSLRAALRRACPKGADVVWETVGGEWFDEGVRILSKRGRLVIIGSMSQYGGADAWKPQNHPAINVHLLNKSATAVGFLVLDYAEQFKPALAELSRLREEGKLRIEVDPKPFVGVEAAYDAVDWLHTGKSQGKVVVQISDTLPPVAGAAL